MQSVRLSETGKLFFKFLGGALCLSAAEYYTYYHVMPQLTLRKFKATPLADKPEYAEEVVLIDGQRNFMFKHRGGSRALDSLLRDTFSNQVFFSILGVQLSSALSLCIAMAKQRTGLVAVGPALLGTNLMLLYPAAHSILCLLRFGEMVADGDEEVWANLNEMRFIQRMEEARSPEMQLMDHAGLYGTLALSFYCSPILASLTSTLVWLHLHTSRSRS